MKKIVIKATFLFFLVLPGVVLSQDTFSIVAVDTITGEIGGAGASCLDGTQIQGGVLIISDIIPGVGSIHTQSYWNATNQQNAHQRMLEGYSPQEIIDWLITHDVQNNPGIRQYGIVDFDPFSGHARSAGYTGANCLTYKNHILGPNYAIQGNILLGQQILDSMESRFNRTEGPLAVKLMAALQGAKVPGADTRCLAEGVSSLSAFVRVARPNEIMPNIHCNLLVDEAPYGHDPIDSLQVLFDQWLIWSDIHDQAKPAGFAASVFPNPNSGQFSIRFNGLKNFENLKLVFYNSFSQEVFVTTISSSLTTFDFPDLPDGLYMFTLQKGNTRLSSGKINLISQY